MYHKRGSIRPCFLCCLWLYVLNGYHLPWVRNMLTSKDFLAKCSCLSNVWMSLFLISWRENLNDVCVCVFFFFFFLTLQVWSKCWERTLPFLRHDALARVDYFPSSMIDQMFNVPWPTNPHQWLVRSFVRLWRSLGVNWVLEMKDVNVIPQFFFFFLMIITVIVIIIIELRYYNGVHNKMRVDNLVVLQNRWEN